MVKPNKKVKWTLKKVKIKDIKFLENNPKIRNKSGYNRLKKSIEKYGLVFSGILNKDLTMIDGHSRFELLKNEYSYFFIPDRLLNKKEVKELRAIYDISRAGDPNWELIIHQVGDDNLKEWFINSNENEDYNYIYSDKVDAPSYNSKEKYKVSDLFIDTRYREFVEEIEKSNLDREIKDFLELSASRFIVFNYQKIANYYGSCDKETKKYFEKLAMVIIDYDSAIHRGFVKLNNDIILNE